MEENFKNITYEHCISYYSTLTKGQKADIIDALCEENGLTRGCWRHIISKMVAAHRSQNTSAILLRHRNIFVRATIKVCGEAMLLQQ